MPYILPLTLLILIIFAPHLWVRHVLKKHHKHLEAMPGTGGELAKHLLEQHDLKHVEVEIGDVNGDHYDPEKNIVCLSPDVFNGKSLSAVAVAAHEVGHALQFNRNEPVSLLRGKYLAKAHKIQYFGIIILTCMPLIGAIFRLPHLTLITAFVGIITMLASVLMYVAILPEEFDASFKKALPILASGGYVPEEHLPAVRQVLKAAALTYVAAALADILRLWRWLAILR